MEIKEHCGICVAHTLHDAYSFIRSLQHRGREAAGIAAIGEDRIDVIKWIGTVERFDLQGLYNIFPGHNYHTYLAHVRYATRGRKEKILEDAHPHAIGGEVIHRGNHILVSDCEAVAVHNGQVNFEYLKEIDKALLRTECDTEAFLHLFRQKGEYEILKNIPGAYTIAIADKRRREVVVLRDRTGIKPGVLGWKDGKYCITSEDIALRKNGGLFVEDLEPGCVYYLDPNGDYKKEKVVEPREKYCFFEWNYIGDVDSIINGVSVRKVRESLGEALAEEFGFDDAEFVTYLPRAPQVAAMGYAKKTGKPFLPVFYKMRGERSFLGSTSKDRRESIHKNLHLLPRTGKIGMKDFLRGKKGVLIDDSTIRGNNSRRARELLYEEGGVEEVKLLNYTPQMCIIGKDGKPRGCMFGVDMPPEPPEGEEYIARGRSLEEISEKIGMPVYYISPERMLEVYEKLGIPREKLCTYCIGGEHPFEF